MDAPPSPNHVFNFPEEEFEEDPQEELEEEFEEDPKEDPEEELEVEAEEDAPLAATPPVGSPITPPPLSESSSDTEAPAPIVTDGALEMHIAVKDPDQEKTGDKKDEEAVEDARDKLCLVLMNRGGGNEWKKSEFKSIMTTEYCPTTKIQRMEEELWTLTLKGDDIEAYNNRFHELVLMCPDLVPNEKKKFERYIKRFPERIKGNITSARPTTLHDAINLARELVEQAVQGTYETILRCYLYGCGEKGNLRHMCPKQRNQQNEGARARPYVVVENPQPIGMWSQGSFNFVSLNGLVVIPPGWYSFVMRRLSGDVPFRSVRYLKFHVRRPKRNPNSLSSYQG
ncbi:putative reverse transcriptase domain-containing protein [Tanacetum coccineum]